MSPTQTVTEGEQFFYFPWCIHCLLICMRQPCQQVMPLIMLTMILHCRS